MQPCRDGRLGMASGNAYIYDRLLAMFCSVCFTGENLRKGTAQEKMERLKKLLEELNK